MGLHIRNQPTFVWRGRHAHCSRIRAFHPGCWILAAWLLGPGALPCVGQNPDSTVQDEPVRTYSEQEHLDISITVLFLSPKELRDFRTSADPVSWIHHYWLSNDPDRETPENEALSILRQRARYLQTRFPDVLLSDIPEPWLLFLRHGSWDQIFSGDIPYSVRRPITPRVDSGLQAESDSTRYATDVLVYQSPEFFRVFLRDGRIQHVKYPGIPSLRRIWEILENPRAGAMRKIKALERVVWYESEDVAVRLLDLPAEAVEKVRQFYDESCRRLAVRRAYCLGVEGARRLAAFTAAGGSVQEQLIRAAGSSYSEAELRDDLQDLEKPRQTNTRTLNRNPHPDLFTGPEELVNSLARRFPDENSVTGWDWRGDLHLSMGPPYHLLPDRRIAYYVYGYPESYRINYGMLGFVDTDAVEDLIRTYIKRVESDIWAVRAEARVTAYELAESIAASSITSSSILEHLHNLAPPMALAVGMVRADHALAISADAVVFADSSGVLDIMASIGIPYHQIGLLEVNDTPQTRLETSCQLLWDAAYPEWSEWHEGGFTVERPGESAENLFLVDTFRHQVESGNYFLYCSAFDPETERSGGVIIPIDMRYEDSAGPRISPIAIAGEIRSIEQSNAFIRGDNTIIPYPGRNLLYGEDLWLYYEMDNMQRSRYGDYAWTEDYFIIPDKPDEGIVQIPSGIIHNSITPDIARIFSIDLTEMEQTYEGPIIVVILITDNVTGNTALSAARFNVAKK
ncbi:hypothetical protein ACFL6R_00340 [Gemmatimonadota bacterium]